MGKSALSPLASPAPPPPPPHPHHYRPLEMKNTKQSFKAKKKPIKVVYISNPMRLTATAADFRATVQKLTGQDSNVAELDAAGFPMPDLSVSVGDNYPGAAARPEYSGAGESTTAFEMFDEGFAPQLLDNFSALYNVCEMWK